MSQVLDPKRPLRIAINAQFTPGGAAGGVETAVTELIYALGKLSEADESQEEYLIVAPAQDPDWLRPFMAGNQRIVHLTETYSARQLAQTYSARQPRIASLKRRCEPLRPALRRMKTAAAPLSSFANRDWLRVPGGSLYFDSLGCDVIHFPYQPFVRCATPSVYNPHDLQHLHFPQFFTRAEIKRRESVYRLGCRHSKEVIVASAWMRQDVASKYREPLDRIQVIRWASPSYSNPELSATTLAAVQSRYDISQPFALYPAATWEHKNHLRLLEAASRLRARGKLKIQIICTGHRTPHFARIAEQLRALNLETAVRFIGRIPGDDLRALYRSARFVIIPTQFEAASAPLFEAWRDNTPVACASVTSLPEQAANAALLFDPFSVKAIADAIRRLQDDAALRQSLAARGTRRLRDFGWVETARAYRAIYRRAANRQLSEEEQSLLAGMNKAGETKRGSVKRGGGA